MPDLKPVTKFYILLGIIGFIVFWLMLFLIDLHFIILYVIWVLMIWIAAEIGLKFFITKKKD